MPARTQPSVSAVPALAARWCPLRNDVDAAEVSVGSTGKRWWRCPVSSDHVYETSVQAMRLSLEQGRAGCPFCRGLRPSVTNRLDVLHPWLADQWHPTRNDDVTPDQIVAGTNRDYWWLCPVAADHEWQSAPQHRLKSQEGAGCPFCRNLRPSTTNRLDVLHPELTAQWHPERNSSLTPADVVSTTHTSFWWQCLAGPDHEWEAPVQLRTQRGHGCPFCSNRRASATNSVSARFPEHAYLFHPTGNPARADQTMANTEVKVWWQCPVAADHEWREAAGRVAANSWAHGRTGCPACSGLQVSTTNRLSNHPALAAELHPTKNGSLTGDQIVAGTSRKLWWQCGTCSHEWQAIGSNRLKGSGCPMCQRFSRSVLEVALGYELATIWPDLDLNQDKVTLDGRIRHVDLIIPSAQLIIEVDGAYRHAESAAKDTAKAAALRADGWHVIRVREQPLEANAPRRCPHAERQPGQGGRRLGPRPCRGPRVG